MQLNKAKRNNFLDTSICKPISFGGRGIMKPAALDL